MAKLGHYPVSVLKISILILISFNAHLTAQFMEWESKLELTYFFIQVILSLVMLFHMLVLMSNKGMARESREPDGFLNFILLGFSISGLICFIVSVAQVGGSTPYYGQRVEIAILGMLTCLLQLVLSLCLCTYS